MRRTALIALFAVFTLACALPALPGAFANAPLPRPGATATATVYRAPTDTPSVTPTLPTPTFTSTPTLIYFGPTETPSDTPYPTSILGPIGVQSTSQGTNDYLTPQIGFGFASVRIDGNLIFYGKCQPNAVHFMATVINANRVASVTIWIRLVDTLTGEADDWGAGAIMNTDHKGNFTYTLGFDNIPHYHDFASAYVQYQLVAKDIHFNDVGRTLPYLHEIVLKACA